jgi:hypothetical protein
MDAETQLRYTMLKSKAESPAKQPDDDVVVIAGTPESPQVSAKSLLVSSGRPSLQHPCIFTPECR